MSFKEFKPLGNNILLYEATIGGGPGLHADARVDSDIADSVGERESLNNKTWPVLVILCTWVGAATPKRIEKYTQGYHTLWPSCNILLIRTDVFDLVARTSHTLHQKLGPVQREIQRLVFGEERLPPAKGDGIVLHMFSQGGCNMAIQLVTSMQSLLDKQPGRELPLRQIVFDSCPGDPDFWSICKGASQAVPLSPTNPLQPFGRFVLYSTVAAMAGLETANIIEPPYKKMRRQLNDPAIFTRDASRLYLTSRKDQVVLSKDVASHTREALGKGYQSDIRMYESGEHCALILENESSYWDAISTCWESRGPANHDWDSVSESDVVKSRRKDAIADAASAQRLSKL